MTYKEYAPTGFFRIGVPEKTKFFGGGFGSPLYHATLSTLAEPLCCAVIFAAVRQVILPSAVIFVLWTSDISRKREEKGRIAAPPRRGHLLRMYSIESGAT